MSQNNDKMENEEVSQDDMSYMKPFRLLSNFPTVSERYYKHQIYNANKNDNREDLLILRHSNRIAVVTLSPTHEVLTLKKKVTKIDFTIDNKVDRLQNQVKGKSKKGAQRVGNESTLCSIYCDDGTTYRVASGIRGKIVEINRRLLDEPTLLTSKPWSDGYIAIILPPFEVKKH